LFDREEEDWKRGGKCLVLFRLSDATAAREALIPPFIRTLKDPNPTRHYDMLTEDAYSFVAACQTDKLLVDGQQVANVLNTNDSAN